MTATRQDLIDAAVEELRLAHRSSPGSEWREQEVRDTLDRLLAALARRERRCTSSPATGWQSDTP